MTLARRTILLRTLLGLTVLLAASAIAEAVETAVPGGQISVSQQGARTRLSGRIEGRRFALRLPSDEGIFPRSLQGVQLVGGLPGRVVILSVDYASRPGNPMGACGAGTETVLRVLALRPRLRQTFHQRVDSCWRTIEAGGIGWDGPTSTLTIERSVFSDPVDHSRISYRISPDGAVVTGAVEQLP